MIPDCTQYFFPINFALLLWPPHCSLEPFKVFWLSFRFWGQCNMKLFTCQKHFIQELWQQLPWVFLEPRTGWVLSLQLHLDAAGAALAWLFLLAQSIWKMGANTPLLCFCHHILPEKGFCQAVKIHLVQCQVLVSGLRGEA